ncbi:unnamed protein product [Hermetia illucens]|uniref:Uncharacterized protein n=1 Tax=Hermetia illucens TaxID=343691 RepID=A0A7R8Z3F1_HERIL|nr:unnamed protein product [Hermetia illucens]
MLQKLPYIRTATSALDQLAIHTSRRNHQQNHCKRNVKDPKGQYSTQFFEIRLRRPQEARRTCKESHPTVYNLKMHNQTLLKDYTSFYETALDLIERFRQILKELDHEKRPPQHVANQHQITIPYVWSKLKRQNYLKSPSFHELSQVLLDENSKLRDIYLAQTYLPR